LENFSAYIHSLSGERLTREQLIVPELLMDEEQRIKMYYVPYDYINVDAKLMLVGITPGFTQMEIAIRTARDALHSKVPLQDIHRRAKLAASFAGTMRTNLIAMLDLIGIPALLGIAGSGELFGVRRELIHTTSAVRYPAFVEGRNYTGHVPSIMQSSMLSSYARSILLEELELAGNALVIPLGKAVADVLRFFVQEGQLRAERCLFDFPHPSGANGHRWKQLEMHREKLAAQVADWLSRG
jgi:hypothetical protein